MPTLIELRQSRAEAITQLRNLYTETEEANRDLTADETQTAERMEAEITALSGRISRQERIEQLDREAAVEPGPNPAAADARSADAELEEQFRQLANGERRSVTIDFNGRSRAAHGQRDLTVGTAAAGGNTVPETFVSRLYEFMSERSAIRQTNVTTLTTASGEKLLIPKVTAHGSAALVTEGGALAESDPTFGQVELDAYKYGQLLQVSSELLSDTGVNLLDFVARDAGRALGEATGAHFISGDGSSKPKGVVTGASAGKTAASATAITADEVIDLYFSVIGPYRNNASWMMNDSTLGYIAKLKDGSNRYLLDPLSTGTPLSIRGKRVVTDHNVAEIAASAKTILFGDFSAYYIRDVGSVRFERSDDYAFGNDLVTFRSIIRTDGDLIDTTGAIKYLAQAAS